MIVYREAGEADAGLLAELFRRSFVDTFGHLYKAEDLDAFLGGMKPDAWRRELADPQIEIRLAEEIGVAAGFAKLGPLSLPVEPDRPSLEVRQLYVLKEWQGAGIAAELMDWLIERARSRRAETLFLSVFTENHRARRFYDRYGFKFVAPYHFMVGSQADEDQIMRLDFAK